MSNGESNQILWRGVQPVEGISGVWPSRNAERVTVTATQAGAGINVIYTVDADKKLFVSTAILSSRLVNIGAHYCRIYVYNAVPALVYTMVRHYYDTSGQLSTPVTYFPALEFLAGWAIKLHVDHADVDAEADLFGWQEDV